MKKFTKLISLIMLFAFSSTLVFGQTNKEVKLSFEESGLSKDKYAAQFDRVENLALTNGNKSFVRTRAILFEGFETWPPTGWTLESGTGDDWIQDDGTDYGPGSAFEGDYAAMYNNYDYSTGTNGSMTTPAFDVSALDNPTVSFYWWNGDGSYSPATIEVLTSADGTTFTSLEVIDAYGTTDYVEYISAIGTDVTHVKLTATSDYGSKNTFVDAFEVKELNLGPELALNYNGWDAGLAENNSTTTVDGFAAYNSNIGDLEVTSAILTGSSGFTTTFDMAAANTAFATAPASATFAISLIDSYGDGWNGASLDVIVDGTVVLDDITIASGSQADFTFAVNNGSDVETVFYSGSYDNEASYTIYNNGGVEVIADGNPPVGVTFTAATFPAYDFGFTFEPTTAGLHTATLTIVSNGGTQVIELDGASYLEGSLAESFETAVPPNGWEANILNGDYNWEKSAPGAMGDYSAMFNSYSAPIGASAELITPQLDLTTKADNMLYFYYAHPTTVSGYEDMLEVYTSEDLGLTWEMLGEPIMIQDMNWHLMSYDLSAFSGDEFKVKFVAISDWGVDILVDMVVGPPIVNGNLAGYVWDEYTGESMEGATITLGSQSAMSNSFGLYSIEQIPIGTYPITCEYPGYNTISTTITITSENVTMHDFYMVREAEFSVDVVDYSVIHEPNQMTAKTFTISNDAEVGAANLDYVVSIDFIDASRSFGNSVTNGTPPTAENSEFGPAGPAPYINPNAPRDAWDILGSFNTSSSAQPGIETDGEHIYTALWNGADLFEYTMDGDLVESFTIAGVSNVRDMAYDGEYFYGSAASTTLFKMDLANQTLVSTITVSCSGVTGVRHISYDPELDGGNGGFWVGNWNELGAIDMDGNELVASISGIASSVYGSAYDWVTEDGPYLWLFAQPTGTEAIFQQFDIASQTLTGVVHDASDAPGYTAGAISGGAATFVADGKLIIIGSIQQDPNLIVAYELAPYVSESWLTVTDGASGSIAPGESANVDIFFDAFELVDVTKNADIVITHNGVVASKEMESIIPAEMIVTPFIHDVSIFDIQFTTDPSGDSPLKDSTVRTTGVITAGDGGSTYFLQDMEQVGSWNGIMIYTWDVDFEIGDEVEVVGLVVEYYGMTEIKDVITELTTIVSSGNTLPAPLLVSTGSFSEQFEGLLVVVENAECTDDDLGNGEWSVNDGTGDGRVDDLYYDYEPVLGNKYNVAGPLAYSYSNFKIEPRYRNDIENITYELAVAPLNLAADVQYRDVVLTWDEPSQPWWSEYFDREGDLYFTMTSKPELATYYNVTDFGYSYPMEIGKLSHRFYDYYGVWDGTNNLFTFKIYDNDGTTLLFESEAVKATHFYETTYLLDQALSVTDNFWVVIEPTTASTGSLTSLMYTLNGGTSHSYGGSPGDWSLYGYEFTTSAYLTPGVVLSNTPIEPSSQPLITKVADISDAIKLDEVQITPTTKSLKTYNLYRNGLLEVSGITGTTYTEENLADGVYTYYVTAVWTVGESPASNVVSVQLFYGSMEGVVVDAEYGVAIPDATIESTDGVYKTTSDSVGFFMFAEVEYGMHDFDVFAEGYYGDTFADIEIIANDVTIVDWKLDREFLAPIAVAVDPYYGIISWSSPFGLTYDDDFESYTLGGFIAEQSAEWTTWDGTTGGATDALISDAQAQSGTQSVIIHNYQETDLVLEMGDQTSGVWEVSLNLFFSPDGDGGYYNILHAFNGGSGAEYAYEFTFDEIGNAELKAAGEVIAVTYNAGEWNLYKTIIDLDSDIAELYVNETMVYTWQWSLTSQGAAGLNQLGAVDVFAASLGDANPFFYMDDVSYGVLQGREAVVVEEAPEFLHYNVYLDDFQVTETNNSAFQYEGLGLGLTYVGSVSAMYSYMGDLHESDTIDVEFTFLETDILAPINLAAVVTNFNDVDLTWEMPVASRFLETILIFRDGELIDEIDGGINTYSEVLGTGLYEYYVQAKYTGFQMSAPSNTTIAEVTLYPPTNLTGASVNSDVALYWDEPTPPPPPPSGEWLSYGVGPYVAGVGLSSGDVPAETTVAIQFNPADLVDYDGMAFSKINLRYGNATLLGDVLVQIWEDDILILEEDAIGIDVNAWNEVPYITPVIIDATKSYKIGYTVTDWAFNPDGCAGCQDFSGSLSSDLVWFNGAWENLTLISPLNYSWLIEAYVIAPTANAQSDHIQLISAVQNRATDSEVVGVSAEPVTDLVRNSNRALTGYNIYRNDELIGTSTATSYFDEVGDGTYTYWVTANYDGFESDTSNNVTLDLITGLDEIAENEISLYPNPASSRVNIISIHEMNRLTVTNYVGQVVYSSKNAGTRVELATNLYQTGVYLVKIETENGVVTKRVIITK